MQTLASPFEAALPFVANSSGHVCSADPQATKDPKLRLLMTSMAECIRTIAYKARWRS